MSHFSLETDLSNALRMDGPISRGPVMRWQKKQNEADCNKSVNNGLNASCGPSKTPVKSASNKSMSKTPSSSDSISFKTPKSGGLYCEIDSNHKTSQN